MLQNLFLKIVHLRLFVNELQAVLLQPLIFQMYKIISHDVENDVLQEIQQRCVRMVAINTLGNNTQS